VFCAQSVKLKLLPSFEGLKEFKTNIHF